MRVTLYRYIGDSDTANKLLKQCTVIYDKEVVPYGAFNPNGASFRLDTLHDVNYAKFTYNSHDYYGYVDVNTDSKGIYNYTITTDPLTTAWYAGCFNVGNLCKYSDLGTGKFFDDRATYSPDLNYEYIQVKPTTTTFRVILVITKSFIQPNDDPDNKPVQFGAATDIYNPLYDVYSMSYEDYSAFCAGSFNDTYNGYRDSVFRVYIVPVDEITSMSTKYTKVNQVWLYYGADAGKFPSLPCPKDSDKWIGKRLLTNTFKIDLPAEGYTYNENWLSTFRVPIRNKPINSWRRQAMIKLYVEDMGYISFKYSDVAKGADITSIGYKKSFDFVSGLQRATLIVNDNLLKDYFIQGQIANAAPYFSVEHVKTFNERFSGSLAAGIGIASGVMSVAPSALSLGLGTGQTLSNILSASSNIISSKMSRSPMNKAIFQRMGSQNVESLKGNSDNAGFSLGARNIVDSMNRMSDSSQGSGYTINGGGTGSLDLPNRTGSFIIWQEAPPHNLADIEGKFGKPDGLVRVVGNLTGWVQTEACHLPSNGLPFDIIDAAERLSDNGFRIVV